MRQDRLAQTSGRASLVHIPAQMFARDTPPQIQPVKRQHRAVMRADQIDKVVDAVNNSGFGLTFGLHTRIDGRVEQVTSRLKVGNAYVNRNQIGAIVGSQPFGGEGLSGTGPKAGGPSYVPRFLKSASMDHAGQAGKAADVNTVQARLDRMRGLEMARLSVIDLPGPTGESNRLSTYGRGIVLCRWTDSSRCGRTGAHRTRQRLPRAGRGPRCGVCNWPRCCASPWRAGAFARL